MSNEALAQQAATEVMALAAPVASKARALAMRAQMEAETEIRALLAEYVERNMKIEIDFGRIPGTPKPTLLKPGAEKLVDLFQCEPQYEITHRIEQWDDVKPLFHYEFRCKIVERGGGRVLAEGFGSANSREGRYRWRNGERKCPACGKPAIIKGKPEYGGGWVCFKKKDGCGEKFGADDPAIVDQQVGKIENDDVFTLVNTVLKMAKKRALVDGAIALARCSDLFTQDVEDLNGAGDDRDYRASNESDGAREQRTGAAQANDNSKKAAEVNPADVKIGKGKNTGVRLGDLSPSQLEWYADNYKSEPTIRHYAFLLRKQRQAEFAAANQKAIDDAGTNAAWGLGDPDVPSFLPLVQWGARDKWLERPLADADAETLLIYGSALATLLEAATDEEQAAKLSAHLRDVEAAIAAKQAPPAENGAPS